MIGWIVDSSLKFRRLVVAAAAALVVVGIVQVGDTRVDALPEFNPPMVEVQTEALGLSAEEVEQLITVPLEQDLLVGVPFLDEIESVSLPGLSSVVMTFERGTELLDARQVVQERLTQAVGVAGLPAVAKPPQMIQPLSSQSRVGMIKLSSDSLTPIEVSVLARWVIGPRLMSVPGVANVVTWGNRERQLQVLVDPARLQEQGATLDQVISTAGNALEVSPLTFLEASTPGTGGFIDTANQRLNIFHEQTIKTPGELAQVPLEGGAADAPATGGAPLALGDVANVIEDHQPLIGDAVCSGGEDCILLVVEKFPGANTIEVSDGVAEALAALGPGMGDIAMDSSIYRPASFVESSFANLGWALLAGGLLLLLLVGAFFWSLRQAVICVAAVAVSAAAAVLVLQLRDTTVNLMVVAGLVAGLTAVIHDAVADTEGVSRALRERDPQNPRVSVWMTIVETSTQMRRAASYAILVVTAAALPLFFLRTEGEAFLPSVALSYLLAVVASMLVALTVTPVLALMLLSKGARASESPVTSRMHRGYDRLAPRLVGRVGAAIAVTAGVAAIGLASIPFIDSSLRPSLKERDVLIHLEADAGTSLSRMTQVTGRVVEELGALEGVAAVGSHVGRAVMSDQAVDVDSGDIWVNVDAEADYDTTVASIEDAVAGNAEVSTDVSTYSEQRVTDVLARSEDDIVVRLYGEDADVLDRKADELQAMVAEVDGVERALSERAPEESTVRVEVDLARAQAFGVKPGDVRRTAASLLGGITVGSLFDDQKVFDVVVWGAPSIRNSANDIEELLVDTPDGRQVRLGEVSDVQIVPAPAVIRHESVENYLDVTATVAGRDVEDVADEVDVLVDGIEFPLEHHAEMLGGYAEQQADLWRVGFAGLAGLVAVVLLLQAAFGSWRLALGSTALLPLALVGGVVTVLLTGATITLGSIAGFLAVLGLAARGLVAQIRRFQHLQRAHAVSADLVLRGTRESLAPTLMSILASALVLAPIAVVGPDSGFEILHPMVVVVLGGLVSTLVLNLFVVPVLYNRFGSSSGTDDIWAENPAVHIPQQRRKPADTTSGVLQRVRAMAKASPLVIPTVVSALLLSSCGGKVEAASYVVDKEPARAVHVPGSDRVRVVVSQRGAERIGIQTRLVEAMAEGTAITSKALFVDTEGHWWVYTNPRPQVFERHEIRLEREEGGRAYLSGGPPPGTKVVTVGVAELAGVEAGIGH